MTDQRAALPMADWMRRYAVRTQTVYDLALVHTYTIREISLAFFTAPSSTQVALARSPAIFYGVHS